MEGGYGAAFGEVVWDFEGEGGDGGGGGFSVSVYEGWGNGKWESWLTDGDRCLFRGFHADWFGEFMFGEEFDLLGECELARPLYDRKDEVMLGMLHLGRNVPLWVLSGYESLRRWVYGIFKPAMEPKSTMEKNLVSLVIVHLLQH